MAEKKKATKKSATGKDSNAALKMRLTHVEKVNQGLINSFNQLNETVHKTTEAFENLRKEVADLKAHGGRNRGPKSTRVMTEDDAERVISGDLAKIAVRKAAEQLGLSYGQVYSAKGGYTFKHLQPIKSPRKG